MWISAAVINHLLQQQPELSAALSRYAGCSVRLTVLGIHHHLRITTDGHMLAQPATAASDCQLDIQAGTWQKIMQQQPFGVGDVRITGDNDLAMALLPLLGQLRYQPYADFSRVFGATAASFIDAQCRELNASASQLFGSLANQLRDALQQDSAPLVSQNTWQQQSAAIDVLRDDVARLMARLDHL